MSKTIDTMLAGDQGILQNFGVYSTEAQDGHSVLQARVPSELVNAAGFAHGSIAYALMDTASAYALGSLAKRGVTIQGDVKYVRGAQGGSVLQARAHVVNCGKRTATIRSEMFLLPNEQAQADLQASEEAELAAYGSFVFQLITVP